MMAEIITTTVTDSIWQHPDRVQELALEWSGVFLVGGGALIAAFFTLVGIIWAKVSELKERANRQSDKSDALNKHVIDLATQITPTVPPAEKTS